MSRPTVLVAVDFDGTLAPIVTHPDLAVPDRRALEILGELSVRPGVEVAVVSGRALADLENRLGELPGTLLIGEHGNDTGEVVGSSEELHAIREFIAALHEDLPGSTVEHKPRSATFHTRNLGREGATAARRMIQEWAGTHADVRLLEGKEVLELTIADRTKGDAIGDLARDVDGTIYIGDDATDETVFEILGPDDVGVKVGEGPTAASYRVADVAEVVELLEVIVLASR